MKNLLINILAVVLGLVIGSAVNMLLIMAGTSVIPAPDGVDSTNLESVRASMHLYGPEHFVFPFLAHALGTLAGALVTCLVAATHRVPLTMIIGFLFLTGGVTAAFMIPAPWWFIALDLIVAYLPMAWLGAQWGKRLRPEMQTPAKGVFTN